MLTGPYLVMAFCFIVIIDVAFDKQNFRDKIWKFSFKKDENYFQITVVAIKEFLNSLEAVSNKDEQLVNTFLRKQSKSP